MTWEYARALGLRTIWGQETGFSVSKDPTITETSFKEDITFSSGNQSTQHASMPEFNVLIEGTRYDNSKEEYPVFTFRDVTYIPLTWEIAVEKLGLSLKMGGTVDLSIDRQSKSDDNSIEIPKDPLKSFKKRAAERKVSGR
ncbi:hypothetical protein [Paenibacillus sp. KR2-11]